MSSSAVPTGSEGRLLRTILAVVTLALAVLGQPVQAQSPAADAEKPLVRFLTMDFVLPGKFRAMAPLAESLRIEAVTLTTGQGAEGLLAGAALVVLDALRSGDWVLVEAALEGQGGDVLRLNIGAVSGLQSGDGGRDALLIRTICRAGRSLRR